MASCLEDTEEKSNGTKLSRLLIDGGTEALRNTFDGNHPPSSLASILRSRQGILTKLRHKKVLNSSQWDKLFPPSGVAPDSKQFDITLLYILLRNICGLTPPATGWDSLPLVTDMTLGANLARIKYFRNEVYGHISSTGVENALFEQYWIEISGALVVLGVNQVDIDALKSSPLGATDYNKMVDEWSVSDKEIREMANDTKKEAQAARKTAEETKLAALNAERAAGEAKTVIEGVGATLTSKMDDLTSEVRQEMSVLVPLVTQGQAKVLEQQGAIGGQLQSVNREQVDLGQRVVSLEQQSKSTPLGKDSDALRELFKSDFTGKINVLNKAHHVGTRSWILDDIQQLLSSDESRGMLISARAGFGKSVIAAVTCQTMQQQGRLAACHFIEHNKPNLNTPNLITGSLARHLCDTVPEFEYKLETKLSGNSGLDVTKMNCSELFDLLLEQPLNAVKAPAKSMLVVIDALDEIDLSKKDEFIKALIVVIPRLPEWIKFVLTIQTQKGLVIQSNHLTDVTIEPENPNNEMDIKQYLTYGLHKVCPLVNVERAVNSLVEVSGGLFLFAHFVVDYAASNKELQLSELLENFPTGLSSVYEVYVQRLFNDYQVLIKGLNIEEKNFFHFLSVVVSSKGPLPEALVIQILGLNGETRELRKAAREMLKGLTHLFPSEEKHITVLHKSLADWLIETEDKEHDFSVQIKDGHSIIAALCLECLQSAKSHSIFPPPVNDREKYALRYGFHHMVEAGGYEEQLKMCVCDLEILSAKFSLTGDERFEFNTSVVDEISNVMGAVKLSSGDLDQFWEKLMLSYNFPEIRFKHYPQFVLQLALHCPVTNRLRKQALELLGKPKYRGLCCMDVTCTDLVLPKCEAELEGDFVDWFRQITCSSSVIACSGDFYYSGCFLATFSVETKKRIGFTVEKQSVLDIAVSADSKWVAVLTDCIELRDVQSLQIQKKLIHYCEPNSVFGQNIKPKSCCFGLSGGSALVVGYYRFLLYGKPIRVWDVEEATELSVLERQSDNVFRCTALPNGRFLTEDSSGVLLLWQSLDPPSALSLATDCHERKLHNALAVSPDGLKICVCWVEHRCIKIFSSKTGELLATYAVNSRNGGDLLAEYPVDAGVPAWFVDDAHVLFGKGDNMQVLNVNSGEFQRVLFVEGGFIYQMCRTAEGEFAAYFKVDHKLDGLTHLKIKFYNLK